MTGAGQVGWKVYAVAVPLFSVVPGGLVYAVATVLEWGFRR